MRDEKREKSPLIAAIKKRDMVAVTRLLETGADPNGRERLYTLPSLKERTEGGKPYPGETVLLIAVSYGELPIVRLLLQKGAEVNAMGNVYGTTPLIEAMRSDTTALAKLLLEHGAKPNLVSKWGETALVRAASYPDRAKHIELLLQAGADPNGGTRETPLQMAAELGDAQYITLLLRAGAKVNFRRPGFGTPLYYAREDADMTALLRKAGGKLRPPVEVKSKNEKSEPRPTPKSTRQITPREQTLTPEDTQILERVLLDFLAYQGKDLFFLNDKPTSLMVINTTRTFSVGSETQLDMDLENEQALSVTLAMRESLVARNATSISLASWKPNSSTLQLRDQKTVTDTFGRFGEKETTVRAAVLLSLPGYSPQRETAVLRFSFSPTPHGASGTYFLKKQADKWEIVWRHFSYYA